MAGMTGRLMIIGSTRPGSLEGCYLRAAQRDCWVTCSFDPYASTLPFIRGGLIGKKLNDFLPVDAWTRKMNRVLIDKVIEFRPDLIMVFAGAPVSPGTIANMKLVQRCKVLWYWPDAPMNLTNSTILSGRLYDVSAIYSAASAELFESLGFRGTFWLPFAGDAVLHRSSPRSAPFDIDLSFVGGWRPERERAIAAIVAAFPHLNIEVHGSYWHRDCRHRGIRSRLRSHGIFGEELSRFFNRSRINLNVIDSANYPSANMRFFEIPISGGLQLASACPELESEFVDRRDIVYFRDETQLLGAIEWVLCNPARAAEIRTNAHRRVVDAHTYSNRLASLVERTFGVDSWSTQAGF